MGECLPIIIPPLDKCYCDYDRDEILDALGMQELITEQTLIDGTTELIAMLVEKYREYFLDFAPIQLFNNGSGDDYLNVIAGIIPQNLNGQDGAWVGGWNINLFDKSTITTGTYILADGSTSSSSAWAISDYTKVKPNTTYTLSNAVDGGSGNPAICFYDTNQTYISGTPIPINQDMTFTTDANTEYVRFSIRTTNNLQNVAQLEKGSTSTAWTPYANVCPIYGWDEAVVGASAKNCFINEGWTKTTSIYSPYQPAVFDANGQLTFYNLDSSMNSFIYAYEADLTFVGRNSGGAYTRRTCGRTSFSSGSGTKNYAQIAYVRLVYYSVGAVTAQDVQDNNTIMLLPGDYDASLQGTFSPYSGHAYNVNWQNDAGLVYDGEIDLVTGVLTVKGIYRELDGTESTWNSTGTGGHLYFYINRGRVAYEVENNNTVNKGCSHFTKKAISASGNTEIGYSIMNWSSSSTRWIFRPDLSVIPDLTAWQNYLATQKANGTPVQIYYRLSESLWTTYQLTPQQIQTFLGNNVIWASTGDIAVRYT